MTDSKLIDPRLQEKEEQFERLHLNNFDIVSHAHSIMNRVMQSGRDIRRDDDDLLALIRSYEVTLAICSFDDSIQRLVDATSAALEERLTANASRAQLLASALQCINLWRILSDIPADLQDNETVTQRLREQYLQHQSAWSTLISELDSAMCSAIQ